MKIKQHIANLFDRLCTDAVISGLRSEIEQLNNYQEAQNRYIEGLNKERHNLYHRYYNQKQYIEALLCNFESKGSMSYEEFVYWHNNYKEGWTTFLVDPDQIRLKVVSFCFRDMYEMTKHPRAWFVCKPELQIGTELKVKSITHNFYGTFYTCEVPDGIQIDKRCIPTYDIPVNNAEVIKWKE